MRYLYFASAFLVGWGVGEKIQVGDYPTALALSALWILVAWLVSKEI